MIDITLDTVISWILSEESAGVMTLLSVLMLYWLYKKQKNNQKEDAAKTIYLEILDIERNIENIQPINTNVELIDKIIISDDHWKKNSHLFSQDFTQREMETINDFYKRSKIAQKLLNNIQKVMDSSIEEKANSIQRQFVEEASKTLGDRDNYESWKNKWLKTIENETYWFLPDTYKQRLNGLVDLIPKITQTNIGTRFSKMSKIDTK